MIINILFWTFWTVPYSMSIVRKLNCNNNAIWYAIERCSMKYSLALAVDSTNPYIYPSFPSVCISRAHEGEFECQVMSGVILRMRLSVSGWSGVSSVGSPILSVGVWLNWVECQCRMVKLAHVTNVCYLSKCYFIIWSEITVLHPVSGCRKYPLHGPY